MYTVSYDFVPHLRHLPQPNTLREVRKFVRKMLKMSSSCSTPSNRNSRSATWLIFGSQAHLKKLRNLSPSPSSRTLTVSRFTERVGITEAGFRCLMTSVRTSSEQRHSSMKMLACCEILKEKKSSLSLQASVLDIFKSSSGSRASPSMLLDTEDDDPHEPPQLKRDYLLYELSLLTNFL